MHLLSRHQSQVFTAFGLSKKFKPLKGVPQGGVESPIIWLISYDICLARLKKKNRQFFLNIYPLLHYPTLPALISPSTPVTITLTSFMDDLDLFFGDLDQLTLGLQTLQKFNNIVGTKANPAKSSYIPFNSPCDNPLIINNQILNTATKYKKQRLLGSIFNIASG
jgi:Reverse transcriptase (RNA-dependent DNA polymerase)